jgi:hypothetical protein
VSKVYKIYTNILKVAILYLPAVTVVLFVIDVQIGNTTVAISGFNLERLLFGIIDTQYSFLSSIHCNISYVLVDVFIFQTCLLIALCVNGAILLMSCWSIVKRIRAGTIASIYSSEIRTRNRNPTFAAIVLLIIGAGGIYMTVNIDKIYHIIQIKSLLQYSIRAYLLLITVLVEWFVFSFVSGLYLVTMAVCNKLFV